MASFILPINEVHRSITRPVTIEIIRRVLSYTGLNPDEFRQKMKGFAEATLSPKSALTDSEDTPNRTRSDKTFELEIEEEGFFDGYTPVRYKDNQPIFFDKDLRIKAVPVAPLIKTTISVVYSARDKVEVANWAKRIKAKTYQMATTHTHEIEYHYPVPKVLSYYLAVMHELREQTEPLNESFGEWCKRCFTPNYGVISNNAGQGLEFVINERQINVQGYFDFEIEPEKADKSDDNAGGWSARFNYVFYYNRPESVVFDFPLMIHNSLLPLELIDQNKQEVRESFAEFQNATDYAQDKIAMEDTKYGALVYPGIAEPYFDDWIPPYDFPPHTTMFSRTLIALDLDNRKLIARIPELISEYEFKDYFLEYFADNPLDLVTYGENIFNVVLYRWDRKISSTKHLHIDHELMISTKEDMQPRDMWHVCLYILINPLALSELGWRKASKSCKVLKDWLTWIAGDKYANKVRCNIDGSANWEDVKKLVDEIKDETGGIGTNRTPDDNGPRVVNGFPGNPKYLGKYGIIAKRKKEN